MTIDLSEYLPLTRHIVMTSLPVSRAQVPGFTAHVFLELGALPVVLRVQCPDAPRQRCHGNCQPIRGQEAHLCPFFDPSLRNSGPVQDAQRVQDMLHR